MALWKQFARKHFELRSLVRQHSVLRRRCEDAWHDHRVSAGMMYKTRLDEDDGSWQLCSILSRIHTFSSKANPQSRFFAAILGRTEIGPVIEFQIVKILDQYGPEIAIPLLHKNETTSHVMITRGTNRFEDEVHDHNVELRPSTELLLCTFRNQKEENLVWKNPMIATRSAPHVTQVDMATRKLVQTISAVLPIVHLCSKRLSFLRTKGSGWLFPPILRTEELCQYMSPKWLQGLYVITIKKNENLMDHIIGTP